jgi:two-component system, sensor histidine kinase and response regulator
MPHSSNGPDLSIDLTSLQALYRVTSAIIQRTELTTLLQTVVDSVAQALPAERVVLITFDIALAQVQHFVKGGTGTDSVVTVSYNELQHGLSGWVLQERRPALSLKATPDPRELPDVQQRRVETDCGDIIVVPLISDGQLLGTLTAINHFDGAVFGEAQVALMQRMADHAAVAISASEYHEQLEAEILRRETLEHNLSIARDQALSASRLKSEFLANMSHEIRTPMNAVLGMVALLQQTELSERQRDYTSKTESAARSLLALLNDILDFSKIEANKMQLDCQPMALDEVLCNLSVLLASSVGDKPIEVLYDLDPHLPTHIVGDAMRLQQVLLNLCSNAIKFTHAGHVILTANLKETQDKLCTIEFAIADTGIGIAPDQQASIFTAFSQAEGSTTRKYGGTGLGLTICKRFVELMGGQLTLESKLGTGSIFTFALSFPVAPVSSLNLPPPQAGSSQPMKVLVIDTHTRARESTGRLLNALGANVALAGSHAQAIAIYADALATDAPCTGIIVGLNQTDLDGQNITSELGRLARQAGKPSPPVVLLASKGRDPLTSTAQGQWWAAHQLLVRPVTASMLEGALRRTPSANHMQRPPAPKAAQRLLGLNILVVEDNPINQQVAKGLLLAQGAQITLAGDGQIAVDLLTKGDSRFDLVLMDLQMPVLDGFGATREIRDTLGMLTLPIVAMTANAMASDRQACLDAGMNEHVSKPFNIDALATLILQFTRGGENLPADSAPPIAHAIPAPSPGLDLDGALQRMSGMTSLYVSSANQLVVQLESCMQDIQDHLAAKDTDVLVRLLHTLKGNTATLGASALSEHLAALEAQLKSHPQDGLDADTLRSLATLMASTSSQLRAAAEHLQSRVPAEELPAAPPAADFDLERAIVLLGEISKLANGGDAQIHALVQNNLAFLETAHRPYCDTLNTALKAGQLSTASAVAGEMMSHLILASLAA